MSQNAAILRILDANFNRAREALRVMEEHARFVLDDTSLSTALKEMRHRLAGSAPRETAEHLLGCRDVAGDVGREVSAPAELVRADAGHVAVAAGKRLSEALRAIEEYAKPLSPVWAAVIKQLRYDGYEIEKRLVVTTQAVARLGRVRLYVIITESLCRGDWFATATAALEGGADALQLREKSLPDGELLVRARRLVSLCRERDALLIVNDRPDIAALGHADGVHVGQDDLSVVDARRVLQPGALVGVSTHNLAQAIAAVKQSPDYLAVGPIFSSPTKPQGHIAGPGALDAIRRLTGLPLVAIGGITLANLGEVLAVAPACVCLCQAVVAAPDVREAATAFRRVLNEARSPILPSGTHAE